MNEDLSVNLFSTGSQVFRQWGETTMTSDGEEDLVLVSGKEDHIIDWVS